MGLTVTAQKKTHIYMIFWPRYYENYEKFPVKFVQHDDDDDEYA